MFGGQDSHRCVRAQHAGDTGNDHVTAHGVTHYVIVDVFDGGNAEHTAERNDGRYPRQRRYPRYQLIASQTSKISRC